jgi:putative ABC transport system permease protein
MKAKRIMRLAWTQMRRRKLRTSLTALGIIVGVMTLVSISALGTGFQNEITTRMTQGFEPDIVSVLPASDLFTAYGFDYLTMDEADKISTFTHVEAVMQLQRKGVVLHKPDDHMETRLLGLNYSLMWQIYGERLSFAEGGLPDPSYNDSVILGYMDTPWAHVGDTVKAEIIVRVGGDIEFRNYTFTVRGILDEVGYSGTTPFDRSFIIPLNTSQVIHETQHLDTIIVKVDDPTYSDYVADKIRDYYEHNVLVLVASQVISTISGIFTIIELFLVGIASIALLVAGVSILNIMLVSVMERTREIGIMKALGARNRTILSQFLAEAALLGFLGSLIGVGLGWILAYGMGQVLPNILSSNSILSYIPSEFALQPQITLENVLIAILFAIAISVIFAVYPARKAAKLDPVQALRYE